MTRRQGSARRLGLGVLCAVLGAQRGQAAPAAIAPWGIDRAGMDRSVAPGDDFVRFGGGSWLANTPIPPDRTSWGPFFVLHARSEQDVMAIVDEVASRPPAPGSIEQKIADFYASYLDAAAIEQAVLEVAVARHEAAQQVAHVLRIEEDRVGQPGAQRFGERGLAGAERPVPDAVARRGLGDQVPFLQSRGRAAA